MKHIMISLLVIILLLTGCHVIQDDNSVPTTDTVTLPTTMGTQSPTTQPSTAAPTETPTIQAPTEPTTQPTIEPTIEPTTQPTIEPTTQPTVMLSVPETILLDMSIEEKVGQMFLARCPDVNAVEDVSAYHLGGYVLFGRDFEGKPADQVIADIDSYQDAAGLPLLIAVDEEGGTVCRVSSQTQLRSSRFPAPRDLYNEGGLNLILSTETEKIELLYSLGINVNLAPVCDVTTDPDAFMYRRSLGQSPEVTGQFIAEVVQLTGRSRFGSVLKHFPGYGNNTDTHVGIAVDERTLEELESVDLVPFAAGIEADADAIMVSHTFVNCLDSELPASLSPLVIGYLRGEMGFDGVITTDDLAMQAITDLYGAGEAAVLAVLAGNDLLCCTEYQVQYQAVLEAVQSGRIGEEQIDQAVLRILNWKYDLGLLG